MELLLVLFLSHFLADYPFQTNAVYAAKVSDPWYRGLSHTAGVSCALIICLAPYLIYSSVWLLICIVSVVHYIQDAIKIELDRKWNRIRLAYVADQLFHVGLLVGLWFAFFAKKDLKPSFGASVYANPWITGALLGALFVTYVWDITRFTLRDPKAMKAKPFVRDWKGMLRNLLFFVLLWSLIAALWQ